MKIVWMIVAGICIAVAAFYIVRGDFNTAFVIAAVGMICWFLNYRAQMKEVITTAESEETRGKITDDDHFQD